MRWPTWLRPIESPPSRRHDAREARQLSEECEAFLLGELAECGPRRQQRPVWVWTNLLAHGSAAQLLRAGEQRSSLRGRAGEWRRARAYLAGEVLMFAERCGSLQAVQQGALVPLELELARSANLERWSPAEWVSTVVAALEAHRRRALAS
ncbi:MAG: hypothetical protein M0004_17335 [Actinomycetota bacterium]|nr:hypothetical protein [Actinomycetota bacterium]